MNTVIFNKNLYFQPSFVINRPEITILIVIATFQALV